MKGNPPAEKQILDDLEERSAPYLIQTSEEGISITLGPEETRRLKTMRYQTYLNPFFVPPLPDPERRKLVRDLFADGQVFYSLRIPGKTVVDKVVYEAFKQVAMEYLVSFGTRKTWKWTTTQDLVQSYFRKDDLLKDLNDFEVLIIVHTGNEVAHTYNLELTQQIVGYRNLARKHTLFICTTDSTVADGMEAYNPFRGPKTAQNLEALSGSAAPGPQPAHEDVPRRPQGEPDSSSL